MPRTPLIAGNWKMHKTAREAQELVDALRDGLAEVRGVDIVLCPPFTALRDVGRAIAGTRMELGAQNMHWEAQGAYTGEVSAPMLWELGCTYVILGHSERRQHSHETDALVARKVAAAFANELIPILCVGETLEQRETGATEETVRDQLRAAIERLDGAVLGSLVVAYEPVWAIGTGHAASAEDANRMIGLIRRWLDEWHGNGGAQTRILYGGSLTAQNAAQFLEQPQIDGALVGGASLDAAAFTSIVLAAVPGM